MVCERGTVFQQFPFCSFPHSNELRAVSKSWAQQEERLGSGARKIIIPRVGHPHPISQQDLQRNIPKVLLFLLFPPKFIALSPSTEIVREREKNKVVCSLDFPLSGHAALWEGNPWLFWSLILGEKWEKKRGVGEAAVLSQPPERAGTGTKPWHVDGVWYTTEDMVLFLSHHTSSPASATSWRNEGQAENLLNSQRIPRRLFGKGSKNEARWGSCVKERPCGF